MPGPGGFEIKLSPGSRVVRCENAVSGHMMVPISDFNERTIKSEKNLILYGTLGNDGAENHENCGQGNGRLVQKCSPPILGRGQGDRQ